MHNMKLADKIINSDMSKGQFLVYEAENGELKLEATVKKYLSVRKNGKSEV